MAEIPVFTGSQSRKSFATDVVPKTLSLASATRQGLHGRNLAARAEICSAATHRGLLSKRYSHQSFPNASSCVPTPPAIACPRVGRNRVGVRFTARWKRGALGLAGAVRMRASGLAACGGRRARVHIALAPFLLCGPCSLRCASAASSCSHGACNGDATLAPGVGSRGARTRRCSRAAAAVWRSFAAQITKRWLRKRPHWAGV